MLAELSRAKAGRTRRVSSYDRTGGNFDKYSLEAGETLTLADISGTGVIRHIWLTMASEEDPLYLKKCVLRMYWDGQDHPSVESPIGDFFGVGHSRVSSYSCAVMNMSANRGDHSLGKLNSAGMNCYWPMPYSTGARITLENQGETRARSVYCYVDYDELDGLHEDELRFHAWWNRANPNPLPGEPPLGDRSVNLSDRDNYLFLEAEGRGHYCGANLSVHNLLGYWWGEGDDMVMIDGDKWPPDIHGTGSEDWFNQAFGSQPHNAFPYNGVSYHNGIYKDYNERITVYRYHVLDPIIFEKSIRVSIEHGHANDRSDDYSSVAYWYQDLPNKPFPRLPPVEARLPRPDATIQPVDLPVRPVRQPVASPFNPDLRG